MKGGLIKGKHAPRTSQAQEPVLKVMAPDVSGVTTGVATAGRGCASKVSQDEGPQLA